MNDLIQAVVIIINEFEKDSFIPFDRSSWEKDSEFISLYLAALKFKEKYG